jgi:hypothetical protein
MTLLGPDALRALDEALRDIRREEDELAKRAARTAELLLKLRAQQAGLIRSLGEISAADTHDAGVGDAVEAAISRFDAAFADAEAELQHIEADLARGNAERTALQADAGRRDAELSALAAKARPRLGTDAGYAARLARARELAAIAEAAEAKAAQAEADREHNGRSYRDDELFMYLWSKGYGTKSDRSRGLVRMLDRAVARLIRYDEARSRYELLTDLPVRLRRHAADTRTAAEAAAADVAAFENGALDSAGGRVAREAIEALTPRIDALDRENVALQDRRDQAIRTRADLALGNDPALALALDELSRRLDDDQLRALRAAAPDEDASLLAQLDDLAQRIKDESEELREHGTRLSILAARRRDIEDIQFELKARGFDNPHSRFSDVSLAGDSLNALVRGEISVAAYWERWRRSQSWSSLGYGGPGGGWGRLPALSTGPNLTRPRPPAARNGLTSAA